MTEGAAGMDLCADIQRRARAGADGAGFDSHRYRHRAASGFEAQIRPRSGLALKQGLTLVNSPGTIDSDYRGEIQVIAINLGNEPIVIQRGQRIAQMIVQRVVRARWQEVEEFRCRQRQDGGFGHTDKKTVQGFKVKVRESQVAFTIELLNVRTS